MKELYRVLTLTAILTISFANTFSQISNYSRTPLSGQAYSQVNGGVVINTTAQLSPGQTRNGDDGTVLVTLPFSFEYNGSSSNLVTMCTNGWLAMGNATTTSTSLTWSPANMFTSSLPNNVIAPWYKDGSGNFPAPNGNGSLVHGLTGTDVYAFEWRNATGTGFSLTLVNNINFMVKLYGPASVKPGRIEFLYGPQVGNFSANAGIGLEDNTGGSGHYLNAINGLSNSNALSTAWPGNGNGYQFDPPAPCSGAPAGGTTTSNNSPVCAGASFMLDVTNATTGSGLVYQWQSSGDNLTWTDIPGQTGSTYNVAQGITTATWFRRSITCSTNTAFSSPLQVTLVSTSQCYCSPSNGVSLHSTTGYPNIETVSIPGTSLNNAHPGAATNGYSQFPATGSTTASLQQGVTYALVTGFTGNGIGSVWVDWNRNGLYETTEWAQITTNSPGGTVNLNVPANASLGLTGLRIRSRSTGNLNGASNACTNFGSGETEEYFVTVIAAQPCSGAPTAGTVTSPAEACAGSAITLNLSGFTTGGGITFQWQSSGVNQNNWVDIAGATGSSASVTQTDATNYRVTVSCNGTNTVYSNIVTVGMRTTNCPAVNDEPCSAITLPVSPDGNCANAVAGTTIAATTSIVNGLTNPVGCGTAYTPKDVWYKVSTGSATTLNFRITKPAGTALTSANLTLFAVTGVCPGLTMSAVTGGCLNSPSGFTWTTLNLTVNNLIPNTTYHLRVNPSASYDPVGDFIICAYLSPQPCSGTPGGGTTASSPGTVCPNKPFTLSVTNGTVASGLTYKWQSSNDGLTWNNVANQGAETYYVSAGIANATYYRRIVKCGTDSAISTPLQVTLSAPTLCYCNTSLHSVLSTPQISSVAITGTTLNNQHTTSVTPGYTQFPASGNTTATLQQGGSYSLVTAFSTAGIASVWIDWNRNGLYEATEWKQITTNASGGTTLLTVPANASAGATGMRIRTRQTGNVNGSGDACSNFGSGETEEYILSIAPSQPCSGTPAGGSINGPVMVCSGGNFTLTATDYTIATGIGLQWQSSPAGQNNWNDIAGATNVIYNANQTAPTDYRVAVSCSTNTAYSSSISVSLQASGCPPVNDEPCGATTLALSSDSNCANKLTGTTNLATVSTGLGYTSSVGCSYNTTPKDVWYKVTTTTGGAGSTSLNFRLAKSANSTMTSATMVLFRMVIGCPSPSLSYVSAACKSSSYGFAPYIMTATGLTPNTDYYLRVSPCASYDPTGEFEICAYLPPPAPACVSYVSPASNGVVPVNQFVTFEWSSSAGATGYDHYIGTTNPPTTLFKTTSALKDSTKFTAYNTKYYWYIAPRNATGVASACLVDSFRTAAPSPNCVPVITLSCNAGDAIKLFTLNGAGTSAISQSSGCSPNAYADYTASTTVTLGQSHAYTGSFWVSDSKDYATIWIDFNDDGFFTDNERLLSNLKAMSTTSPTAFTINIPTTAPLGNHRLRIRNIYYVNGPLTGTDPCNSYQWGEAEDYTVEIVDAAHGSANPVSTGNDNSCMTVGWLTVDVNSNNNNRSLDIIDANGNMVATLNANGNNLGIVDIKVYKHVGAVRTSGNGIKIMNRNIAITPEFQPTTPVTLKLYFTNTELQALMTTDPAVTGRASLNSTRTDQGCESLGPIPVEGTLIMQTGNGAYGGDHFVEISAPALSNFYLHRGNTPLPITIASFRGERLGESNKLSWITSSEVNNAGFELQRSSNGSAFKTLAFIPSKAMNGNSTGNISYDQVDVSPFAGNNYYRLRQIDKDGKSAYSNVVLLKASRSSIVTVINVYPNPASDILNVLVTSPASSQIDMVVTDIAGKIVKKQAEQLITGDNNIKLNIASLASGSYLLKVICSDGCEGAVSRFVKE